MKIIIRKEIKEKPTEKEIYCMKKWGQKIENKCLDCGKSIYYFNQCEKCNEKMITTAKLYY